MVQLGSGGGVEVTCCQKSASASLPLPTTMSLPWMPTSEKWKASFARST